MRAQTTEQSTAYEQKLMGIVRKLPPERITQVIDFAQFLEFRITGTLPDEEQVESTAEDARWDALLATDESQRLLEKIADEALADIRAGHARPMVFTEEGEIALG